MSSNTVPAAPGARELTVRGVIIGGLITLVFTAANVYLGLKVGLTFATSIPAAVISMAILRYFRDHSVAENNIVQTIASAAGTLSAIIFVLPGLVMIGWWTGFPYWQTALVTALGGVLGVMYSIPCDVRLSPDRTCHFRKAWPRQRCCAWETAPRACRRTSAVCSSSSWAA